VNAPQWRRQILTGVKPLLRVHGYRGGPTRYWKILGDRLLSVQFFGGSDPHDTQKLWMHVYLGVDFMELDEVKPPRSAYLGHWHGMLPWTNSLGIREMTWRAYSDEEAEEVLEGIQAALPETLESVESRFKTWHDVLAYLDPGVRDTLDPPGRVNEMMLPEILPFKWPE
jgi:hypothetical protein